ncbi:hypothetical protein HanRHA438_Chr16g0781691 [Helianthus annuus]|nr:hypothetical protein HanRHA438_Chr16g0781691 [Helianthus annuus]
MLGCFTRLAMIHCSAVDVVSVPALRNSLHILAISSSVSLPPFPLSASSSGSCKFTSVSTYATIRCSFPNRPSELADPIRDLMSGINTSSLSLRNFSNSFHLFLNNTFPNFGKSVNTANRPDPALINISRCTLAISLILLSSNLSPKHINTNRQNIAY